MNECEKASIDGYSVSSIVDVVAMYGIDGVDFYVLVREFDTNVCDFALVLSKFVNEGLLRENGMKVCLGIEALVPRLVGKSEDELRAFLKGSKS